MVVVRYRMRRSKDDQVSAEKGTGATGWYGQGPRESAVVKKTEKRSRNGCLTCRARRKKCDETKPKCIGCQRNLLPCRWAPYEKVGYSGTSPAREDAGATSGDGFLNCTLENWEREYDVVDNYRFFTVPNGHLVFEYTVALNKDNSIWRIHSENGSKQRLQKFPTHGQLDKTRSLVSPKSGKLLRLLLRTQQSYSPKEANYPEATGLLPKTGFYDLHDGQNFPLHEETFEIQQLFDVKHVPYHLAGECRPVGRYLYSTTPINTVQSIFSYLFYDGNAVSSYYNRVIAKIKHGCLSDLDQVKNDDAFLFYVCVKEYLPTLGLQDITHSMFTTNSSFLTEVENNPILKEIFICCAASYLEYYSTEAFASLSDRLYENTVMLVTNFLRSNQVDGNELWLLASFHLMCMRNKLPLRKTVDDCVRCLARAYVVIRNSYYSQHASNPGMQLETIPHFSTFYTEDAIAGLNCDSWDLLNRPLRRDELILLPQERTLLEAFIYNYSVVLLFATNISQLPNPFYLFKEFNPLLSCAMYSSPTDWFNNPLLGTTIQAFEIIAKVSYVARYPMPIKNPVLLDKCLLLQKMAINYEPPSLEGMQYIGTYQFHNIPLYSLAGLVVARSSYLLVSKVINYLTLQVQSSEIQDVVNEIMTYLDEIPLDSNIWSILPLPLLICGFFCINVKDQNRIKFYLDLMSKLFNLQKGEWMGRYLTNVWAYPLEQRLDYLFDRAELCRICI